MSWLLETFACSLEERSEYSNDFNFTRRSAAGPGAKLNPGSPVLVHASVLPTMTANFGTRQCDVI